MKYIIFTVLSVFVLGASSCKKWQKKYPEDTEKSKLTPVERISNKWWVLQSASLNGIDYTDSVYQQFGMYKIYFSDNIIKGINYKEYYQGSIVTDNEIGFNTVWQFFENESIIGIAPANGNQSNTLSIVVGYLNNTVSSPVILKLSRDELKFSMNDTDGDTLIVNSFIAQ